MSRVVLACIWLFGTACGDLQQRRDTPSGRERGAALGGSIVSIVDGAPIRSADVQSLAQRLGVPVTDALSRLQAEELLAAEAERAGYGGTRAVLYATRQQLVQALLAGEIDAIVATDEEVADAYRAQARRFNLPERRSSVHVLAGFRKKRVTGDDAAAQRFASDALLALRTERDLDAALRRLAALKFPEFNVRVERLPAVANDGAFVPEFMAALFAAREPGAVSAPVRTEYGWHAIYVTEVLAPETTPLDAARATLRAEIELGERTAAMQALLQRITRQAKPSYARDANALLAAIEL